jgi:diguanylate cyclase (GGDEF)-like protein/PAS domain S-box-containing protein
MKVIQRRGLLFLSGICATVVCFGVWAGTMLLEVGGPDVKQAISNTGLAFVALTAAAACGWVARRGDARERRVWGFVGLGCLSWGLGQTVWTIYESVLHTGPFPSPADIGYTGLLPLFCVGLLGLASAPRGLGSVRALLDGVMIAGSVLVISWITVLGNVVASGDGSLLSQAVSIYYPLGDVVLVTMVLYVVLRLRQQGRRVPWSLRLVAVGIAGFAFADSGFAYLTLIDKYHSGSVIDLGWFAGFALIGLAALRHLTSESSGEATSEEQRPLGQLVPYAAISAAFIVTAIGSDTGLRGVPLAVWAFIIGAVMVRQVLALHENLSLTRGLEARVVERTAELQASERRFRALVQHSSDVVTVVDGNGIVIYQADSIESVFGYRPDDLVGRSILTVTGLEAAEQLGDTLLVASGDAEGGVRVLEVELRHASGRRRHAEMTVTNLLDDPNVGGLVLNTRDVSERRALERRLVHDAFHDTLTHLPNRNLFLDRLRHALDRSADVDDVAIMFIDLDGFKKINDTLGHAAGDQLLVDVAQMLQECMRPGDTVARLGGDEFAILVEDVGGDFGAVAVAERVCARLCGKLTVQGQDVFLRASVGVAVAEEDSDGDSLLRSADLAMYRAKAKAEGGFALYDHGMHETLVKRVRLESELRDALDADQLVLHYQPTWELASGRLVGFEALVRWEHPDHGLIQPGMFIPLAEETGLIHQIGRIVLRAACLQGGAWIRRHPELAGMSLAVNLSAPDLRDPSLPGYVAECLLESGLPPECLVLEMTETMLIEHSVEMIEQLQRLKALGVRLAIDDFGTGFSSLSYLHRFPVDILKIDRSFIERVASSSDAEFVRTIVQLGRSLSLTMIAEGIEGQEQLVALRLTGCEQGQGFHFSPAITSAMVEEHLPGWVCGIAVGVSD